MTTSTVALNASMPSGGHTSRVAPQIDIFSVGFPVTLAVGLLGMVLTLPALQQPFTMALERVLSSFR
jgi:flagellar biosynthesis protein FliR